MPTVSAHAEVWGSPIAHSLSPSLHLAAYSALGLDWKYARREVTPDTLAENLAQLDASCVGLSLTMPLKEAILPLVQARDPLVNLLGAANTVWRDESGWSLANTDPRGVEGGLRDLGRLVRSAWILGAGATARSVGYALQQSGCERVVLLVRTVDRAKATQSTLATYGLDVTVQQFDAWHTLQVPDLVVSTLPGDAGFSLPGDVSAVVENAALFDVSYAPWPSAAAKVWASSQHPVVSGLTMLTHQALIQVRLFHHGDATIPLPGEDQVLGAMKEAVSLPSV